MHRLRPVLLGLLLVLFPSVASAQKNRPEAIVIFKDGFHLRGRVMEKSDVIFDSASGQSFRVPAAGGFIYLDDHARRLHFSTTQIQEVIKINPSELKETITLKRSPPSYAGNAILPSWQFEKIDPWNSAWERVVTVFAPETQKRIYLKQRITTLTPYFMRAMTLYYAWDLCYLTQELGPTEVRDLVVKYHSSKVSMKEADKVLVLARFLRQAGWPEAADKEVQDHLKNYPGDAKTFEGIITALKEQRAGKFVDDLKLSAQVGRHEYVHEAFTVYDREDLAKVVEPKAQLAVQDLRAKVQATDEQLKKARALLQVLPAVSEDRPLWTGAARLILQELTPETLPRLETFIGFAEQHKRELDARRKPSQRTEEVMALAVTGWLQGNQAAEPDPKTARTLLRARRLVLDYLKSDSPVERAQLLKTFQRDGTVAADVLARLVTLVPPADPYPLDKLGDEPLKMSVSLADGEGSKYLLKLPPEYNHNRPYPVLIALHGAREKAETLLSRWEEQAARHGFILAVPTWSRALKPSYGYSAAEHAVVLDTLRDLRRRFQVDSDRVFLFGWEQGATMAFDVGMAHPGLFAGVLPMNGSVRYYPQRYWSNAQYLPFYVVEGESNGGNIKMTRALFKEWNRGHYPSIYIEYKGRGSTWFSAEIPHMMNWMSRKKRHHPMKELGRYHTGGREGEEFRTMRHGDNRFYWLGTEEVHDRYLNDVGSWRHTTRPATLQANISVGNVLEKGKARVWTGLHVRTRGVKQVTVWLGPGMIDFSKPLQLYVNGQQVGRSREVQPSLETLLEGLATTGDRQRLYFAKIAVNLRG